jgi:hypothetical protein
MKHSMSPTELAGATKLIASARAKTAAQRKLLTGAIKTGDAPGQLALTSWLLQNLEALLTSSQRQQEAEAREAPAARSPLQRGKYA